jgi:hypothetical protein
MLPLPATPPLDESPDAATNTPEAPSQLAPGRIAAWDVTVVIATVFLLPLTGGDFKPLLATLAPLLIIVAAFDISARVGAPNIAVSAVASLGAIALAKGPHGFVPGLLTAIVGTLIVGALFAWAVIALKISPWAVSVALIGLTAAVSVTFLLPPLRVRRTLDVDSSWIPSLKVLGAGSVLLIVLAVTIRPREMASTSGSRLAAVLVASCVVAGIYGGIDASAGQTLNLVPRNDTMLFAITASVVGGTSLSGRRAGIVGRGLRD